MATEQRLLTYGFPVAADLHLYQFCPVNVSSGTVALAGTGLNMDGILQDAPNTVGQSAEVAMFGVSKALSAGNGFAADDLLEVYTSGAGFQTKSSGVAVAKAVTAATAGAIGTVIILTGVTAFKYG